MPESPVPVINLDADPTAGAVEAAYRVAGCFNIAGRVISDVVTRRVLQSMQEFFALPDNHPIKCAAHNRENEGSNGWTPMLDEPAYEPGTIAWVESFDCVLSGDRISQLPAETRDTICRSIWPPLPDFRKSVRAQWDALIEMGNLVYPLVSAMLKQDSGFLEKSASSQVLNTMRLLNYPPRPETGSSINRGISAHTDFECITFIYQTAPGLEVQTPAGNWIQVPVTSDQWTVLFGDMIERWSNGRFRATPHRVPVTAWPRQSIVMFMAANAGLEIQPLDAFINPDCPAAYETVTQEALIDAAMVRAEANRLEMLPEAERLRAQISPV